MDGSTVYTVGIILKSCSPILDMPSAAHQWHVGVDTSTDKVRDRLGEWKRSETSATILKVSDNSPRLHVVSAAHQ